MLLGEGCDKRMHPLATALRRLDAVPERDTQTGSKSHFTGFLWKAGIFAQATFAQRRDG